MKTLLVEDNPADARLIREMLKEHKASTFEVQHVTRLDMALKCLCEETFDVLLLDLGLPDSQGMETLVVAHKACGGLPIVVLTGLDDEHLALEVMRAGAQDYLVKGRFDTELLVRTIRYAVKRKQAEEEVRRLNAELEMRVAERTLQLQAANEELHKELAERKRAEEAVREGEKRYRNLFNAMNEGFCVIEVLFGADGKPEDYRFLEVNEAFERQTGLDDAVGKRMRDLAPDHEAHWFEIYGKIALTGEPAHFMNEAKALNRFYDVHAYRVGEPEQRRVAIVFNDFSDYMRAKEALRESEERLRFAQQAARIGAFEWNVQTGLNIWTPELEAMYGLAPGEFGKTQPAWEQLVHPEDRAAAVGWVKQAFETGEPVEGEWRVLWRDGSLRWISGRFQLFKDAAGQPLRLSGVNIDITERKRSEEALRANEERLRMQMDRMPIGCIVFDRHNCFNQLNPAAERILGYAAMELRGQHANVIVPEKHRPHVESIMRRLAQGDMTAHSENENLTKNGATILCQWTNTPLRDGAGNFSGFLSMVQDITERRRAEEALEESEELFQMLTQNLVSSVALIDAHGEFSIVNKSFLRLFDLDVHSGVLNINSRDWSQWQVFDENGRLLDVDEHPVRQAMLTRTAVRDKLVAMQTPGRADLKWLLVSAEPILDGQGNIQQVICTYHDITERKRVERELQATLQRFYMILSSMYPGVVLVSPEGVIEFANQAFCDTYSLQGSPADLVGLNLPQLLAKVENRFLNPEAAIARILKIVERAEPVVNEEFALRDGRTFLRDFVPLNVDGKPYGELWLHRDITQRKQAEESLREQAALLDLALDSAKLGWWAYDPLTRFSTWDERYKELFQVSGSQSSIEEILARVHPDDRRRVWARVEAALDPAHPKPYFTEYRIKLPDDSIRWIEAYGAAVFEGEGESRRATTLVGTVADITERKHTEQERETTIELLRLVNQGTGTRDLVHAATVFFQQQSGCSAVGIRLREGDDYPYFESRGFPKEFLLAENSLCARDAGGAVIRDCEGNPQLECMCGNVICGRTDPSKPFFTANGSFYTNSTTRLLDTTSDADRQTRTRNRCNGEGYESVALIPLRAGEQRLGLLQFNDRRPDLFSPALIGLWERLAGHLALALAKCQAEEALLESQKENEFLADLIRVSSQPLCVRYPDGRFELVNRAFEELTGYSAEELRSLDWTATLTPPEWHELEREKLAQLHRTGAPVRYEKEYVRKDGTRVPIELLVHLAKDSGGKPQYYFSFLTDITERKRAANALQQSLERLEKVLEVETVGVMFWDLSTGYMVDANDGFLKMMGYSRSDVEERKLTWQKLTPPEYLDVSRAEVEKFLATGRVGPYEKEYFRKDGTRQWLLFAGSSLGGNQCVEFCVDISDCKQAEAELKKLNRTLEATSNSNEALLRATDEQSFLKEVCNIITRDCDHAMVWIGIAENNEGKTIRPVAYSGVEEGYLDTLRITWDSSAQGGGAAGTAIRSGLPSICRNMLTDPAFAPWREEAIKRGYASVLAIPLKESGETLGAICIYSREPDAFAQSEVDLLMELARDLEFGIHTLRMRAAHARAEEALRESEEQLSLFVEHAPAALAMFDNQMRYLRVSQRWRADFGLGDRELFGVSHYDIFPEVSNEWKEAHRKGLAGEVLRHEAERFERADGTVQWVRWEVHPWRDAEGMVGGILIFTEDVTEHIQAQEAFLRSEREAFERGQLRALAEKMTQVREEERKQVARDLHDDIGQLLTAIKMDLTWTKRHLTGVEGEVQNRLTRSIEMIGDGAKSVRNICNGLRPGVLDDLGLPAAIEWQASDFASRTGIDCEVVLPSTEPHIDSGRATAIFRIFQECLTNVIRHAEAKSVRVSLREEFGSLFLIVQDDGVGFPESSASNSMGSLGLLGMNERAQACGGQVMITSSPGNGTTVTIRVPVNAAPFQSEEK